MRHTTSKSSRSQSAEVKTAPDSDLNRKPPIRIRRLGTETRLRPRLIVSIRSKDWIQCFLLLLRSFFSSIHKRTRPRPLFSPNQMTFWRSHEIKMCQNQDTSFLYHCQTQIYAGFCYAYLFLTCRHRVVSEPWFVFSSDIIKWIESFIK